MREEPTIIWQVLDPRKDANKRLFYDILNTAASAAAKTYATSVINNWVKKGQDWLTTLGTSISKTQENVKVNQENTNENDENGNTDNRWEYH